MPDYSLHFADHGGYQTGVFRLIELPKELIAIAEGTIEQSLTIRGGVDEDAVLCTTDRTFSVRAVTLSNTYFVLAPSQDEADCAVIRGSAQQILELAPSVAKLHKLNGLLRGREYDGFEYEKEGRGNNKSYSLETIRASVQASDKEFEDGLRERRILILNGELRPITMSYLSSVLELILNTMVASSLPLDAAPVADITETLESDHDISSEVTQQVMSWFGKITRSSSTETVWDANVENIVRQLGIGLLSGYRNVPTAEENFMEKWRQTAGDAFEARAQLSLLSGNYICRSSQEGRTLAYFPSSELPVLPSDRFSDLFLTQSRWRADEIAPFLKEIAVDSKERDKLLMKYARTMTDSEGQIWYTSRSNAI